MSTCVHVRIHTCMFVCPYVYIYIHIFAYLRIYVCMLYECMYDLSPKVECLKCMVQEALEEDGQCPAAKVRVWQFMDKG